MTFDQTARTTIDYQSANDTASQSLRTQTFWDPAADRVLAANANNQVTSYVYNAQGLQTDVWGPGDQSCFSPVNSSPQPNESCTLPHTSTVYDEGMNGLAATAAVSAGSQSACTVWAGRPFFMTIGVTQAS